MTMPPHIRRFVLTAHIASSVGWLGAVVAFLALAIASLVSEDAQRVRAASLMMELTGWSVLVPLSLASLVTGIVQSLGSTWGLFRHYWVLFKLLINLFASIVLLMYMPSLRYLADTAADVTRSDDALQLLRSPSATLHAGAALVLLLVATVLSVYKPQGMTPYGRKQLDRR